MVNAVLIGIIVRFIRRRKENRMRILCDRCKKQNADFDFRDKWAHIELSEKGFGKLGNYYLCPKCASDYYKFIGNETVIGGEEEDNGCSEKKADHKGRQAAGI